MRRNDALSFQTRNQVITFLIQIVDRKYEGLMDLTAA